MIAHEPNTRQPLTEKYELSTRRGSQHIQHWPGHQQDKIQSKKEGGAVYLIQAQIQAQKNVLTSLAILGVEY